MHLIRVLEVGIQAVADDLGIPAQDNWNTLLDQIERVVPEVTPKRNGTEDGQWFSEVAAHFRLLKDAWRNSAIHANETYSQQQAEIIFEQTRNFMNHLATRLADHKILCLLG